MSRKQIIGKIGEDLACGYLVNKGYEILTRNYREKFGEIDIVSKSPDKTLVFVEVKTMSSPEITVDKSPASYPHLAGLGSDKLIPEDQISESKMDKFKKIGQWYANKYPELTNTRGYRFDAITILINQKSKEAGIRHYKNIIAY